MRRRLDREATERVVRLASYATRSERALVEAVYADGMSVAELSRLTEQPVRALRRKLKRVVERVTGAEYAFVALHREAWPASMRRVASACVLEGKSLREAGVVLGMSLHAVRRQRDAIRTLYIASGA